MVLAVSSGTVVPAQMRAAGAATIFFDLHLNDRVGTTSAPADPATIELKAKKLFDFAVEVTGCATPLIAENELFGAQTPTPWSTTNAQYRANVLLLLQDLAALGATPAITIANPPYTGGEAADWWREAAKAAILIRQVYFTSPGPKGLIALGPARASRSMRKGMRGLVAHFGAIGIPASRVALELQFQSAPGQGGRQGLQPTSAWLELVKLEALAAKQVGGGHEDRGHLVVGLAELLRRRQRSRQARGRVRLPVDARPEAVRRARRRRRRFQRVTHRGPDRAARRRPLHVRHADDREGRRRADAALTGDLSVGCDRAAAARRAARRPAGRPQTVLAAERAIVRDSFGGSARAIAQRSRRHT